MAGSMSAVVYTAEDGNTYKIRIAGWAATLQSATAATTQASLPKGVRPRHRYFRITATGREGRFVVCDPANAHWTDPAGTAVTVETGVYGSAGIAGTLQGRTGERDKAI